MLACALWVTPAGAATIAVDSTNDAIAEDGRCSLREAITAANTDQPSGVLTGECPRGNGPDTIKLPAGMYTLTKTGSHEDANASGDLDIESDMTIEGAGAGLTAIDGNASVVGPSESDRVFDIFGTSHVTISNVTIRDGIAPSLVGADQDGGGVLIGSTATVTLSADTITDNKAGEGPINTRGGDGGGIENEGVLTLLSSTVSENAAGNNNSGPTFREGVGGGIDNAGRLKIQASVVKANHTTFSSGNGALPGGPGGGIASSGPSLAIDSSTIAENFTAEGGIGPTAGTGGDGGGLMLSGGTLTLTNSTVAANRAGAGGFGIEVGGVGGNGGGLALAGSSAVLTNDTLYGNLAGAGGEGVGTPAKPSGAGGNGGAIFHTAGSASLTNVTIAGNAAGAGGKETLPGGGGADGGGGGIYTTVSVNVLNSILSSSALGGNCAGAVFDQGHNIDFSGGNCPVSFLDSDPRLGQLQDNGGPTQTMALMSGSGALDQVPLSGTGCPAIDQRGVARPQGAACDIGAYELASPPTPTPLPVPLPITTPETPRTTTPTSPIAPPVPPVLGPLKLSPTTFHAATSGASIAKRKQTGTSVSYTDSGAATTTFTVLRFQPGVRKSGHCVAPPKHGHGGSSCLRLVQVGRFTHLDKAGRNSFHFTGRAGGKSLGPGLYVLEATPRLGGLSGTTRTTRFTIAS